PPVQASMCARLPRGQGALGAQQNTGCPCVNKGQAGAVELSKNIRKEEVMRGFKRTVATLAGLLLGGRAVAVQAQPQFSGAYTLDRSQSQFPQHEGRHQRDPQAQPAQPPEIKLVVEQHGTTLKVTRTIAMGTRERSETNTYIADGTDQTTR